MAKEFNARKLGRVMKVVKYERCRQLSKWGDKARPVAEHIMLMEDKLREARIAWCANPGDLQALMEVSKLSALTLACLTEHADENTLFFTRLGP